MNYLRKKSMNFDSLLFKKCLNQLISQNRWLSENSVRLSYNNITPLNPEKSGQNSCPVFIYHGLFGSKNNWKSISKAIASKTGRSVYAFDLRNHGLSPHTSGPESTLQGMANDIKLFMDENNYEKAALIGHSLGGRAVMQFSFIWPERVEKLIAVDITPLSSIPSQFFMDPTFIDRLSKSITDIPNELGLAEARKLVNKNLIPIIRDQFIRGFFLMSLDKEESGKVIWRINLDAIKYMIQNKHINKIKIERPFSGDTLLIHGQNSEYVNPNDYNAIREVMPNIKIVSIPETGHYLHIEKPNELINYVVSFLEPI